VENSIGRLIGILLKLDRDTAQSILNGLTNDHRLKLIKTAASALDDKREASLVTTFVKHALICASNSNLLAHTHYITLTINDETMLGFKTRYKDKTLSQYRFHIEDLRGPLIIQI